ncbi:hypothetical protein M569_13930 [Genlisea aurea]|uniref:Proline dehydrogenase n=1 Tax=Genlisea aurea TaxID=192259 RepID=S8C974_9LAMI|nr:hypothetical protein M569_13930 [Genlisea aurea]
MAGRSVSREPIRTIRSSISSAAVPPLSFPGRPRHDVPIAAAAADDDDDDASACAIIDLRDTKRLFSSIPTPRLVKSIVALRLAGMNWTADFGAWALNPRKMQDPLWRKMVLTATEHTFYHHFCAGKDLSAAAETVERLRRDGLYSMLDYGLESAGDNASCDDNSSEFLKTLDWIQGNPSLPVSFLVVKVTAICPPKILKRVSDLLRWEHKNTAFHLPWKLRTFPLFSHQSPFYHTPTKPRPLDRAEENDLTLAYRRLVRICKRSRESGVPLLIDAEDTSIQPAIDYLAYSAAIENTPKGEEKPVVYNTIQAYLKDSPERLVAAKRGADEMGIPLGFKLVRGAYMSSENRLAAELGVDSPIHDSVENTHSCYNSCAAFLLEEVARGASGFVVLATHNVDSGKLAARKASELGIEKSSERVQFAQLYSMAEALSYGLKNGGFRVSKYIPFGPVEQIIPYLLRRAEENRGLLSSSVLDRHLMSKEVLRRIAGT